MHAGEGVDDVTRAMVACVPRVDRLLGMILKGMLAGPHVRIYYISISLLYMPMYRCIHPQLQAHRYYADISACILNIALIYFNYICACISVYTLTTTDAQILYGYIYTYTASPAVRRARGGSGVAGGDREHTAGDTRARRGGQRGEQAGAGRSP